MSDDRSTRLVCFHCSVPLAPDDAEHYGYQCHDCVVEEHELILTWLRDPDHPDAARLFSGPVDLGLAPAGPRRDGLSGRRSRAA
jgi:hypothetical protein